ncbi:MAG TPA: hypothetical protein VMU61_00555 [Candidatus Aquilonibacter sp.]|nr:hypothetical protein [Candidatus Aquilonibacter sp.]
MNTQSNAMPETFAARNDRPVRISAARLLYWSVRRELWEYRSIYLAPMAVAAVFLFGFLISTIHLSARMRAVSTLDPMRYRAVAALPYDFVAGLMMATGILISVFYCLDALYGERRDRSILFWKSMPVSDLTTVLAKASIPLIVLPLLVFAVTVITQLVMLLWSSAVLAGSGLDVGKLWASLSFFRMSALLLYHLVTAHALWPAPVYCWLLLVSAWARRAPFLWAVLPPFAIAGVEGIVFHTSHFARLLAERFIGGAPVGTVSPPHAFPTGPTVHVVPLELLSAPGLWIGLLIAAAFLLAAVRMRRYSEPI